MANVGELLLLEVDTEVDTQDKWVVLTKGWSGDHHLFWKDDHRGYTSDLLQAGLYEKDEALLIEVNRPKEDKAIPLKQLLANGGIVVAVNSERVDTNLWKLEVDNG